MKQIYLNSFVKGYARKAMYNENITQHPLRHIIEQRVKILSFFDDYGEEATKRAFGVSRATIYSWKRRLKQGQGRLTSLAPISKRPKVFRRGLSYAWHRQTILELREEHPGLGKDKLQILLNSLCLKAGQPTISTSTVGRLVTDLQARGLLMTRRQLTLSARTGKLLDKRSHRIKLKKARRGSFRPQQPGDLVQIDCVIKITAGIRRYIISAIDYRSQFAFSYGYKTLSSTSSTDFLVKLRQVAPFEVKRVQTDNGSEFYKYFHEATEKLKITHFWNYPGSPKMNAKIERYNRTIQEEFADWKLDELTYEIPTFNDQLMDWLIWYNTKRPHHTLKLQTPIDYLLDVLELGQVESRMLWTNTLT